MQENNVKDDIRKFVDREEGLKFWKQKMNYHRRSLVEVAMFRLKTIFGDKISNKKHLLKWPS